MKNYRNGEAYRGKEEEKAEKISQSGQKNSFPAVRNTIGQTGDYQNLAKRAKQQLREIEERKRNSPDFNRQKILSDQNKNDDKQQLSSPRSTKANEYVKSLNSNYSQKYFKKDDGKNELVKEARTTHKEDKKLIKISSEGQLSSPKKKNLDSNEYKKLHEKLDSIENKITDMKKNLQRKREEKHKIMEIKMRRPQEQKGRRGDEEKGNQDKTGFSKDKNGVITQKKVGLKGLVTQMPEHAELHTFNSNPYSPRHNIYYVSELVRAYLDERSLAREHVNSSLSILKILEKSKKWSEQEVRKFKLNLPRRKGYQDKKTLVFDLDETLIHCNQSLNSPCDVKLPIKFPTGESIDAGINIRPHAKEILKNLSRFYQIIVFTASHSCYANVVLDYLDPHRQWIHHRLYRQHCYLSAEGMYIKDLRILDRDLKDILLVDNAAYSYALQLENGIPILPYYHGSIDFQLKMLEQYLMRLAFAKDVREVNQKTFKLSQYKFYYNKPEKMVEQLYIGK